MTVCAWCCRREQQDKPGPAPAFTEKFYMRVEPNQDRVQGTIEGHEWVVREDCDSQQAASENKSKEASVLGRVVLAFKACSGRQVQTRYKEREREREREMIGSSSSLFIHINSCFTFCPP